MSVETAIGALRLGRPVLVVDEAYEGDVVLKPDTSTARGGFDVAWKKQAMPETDATVVAELSA